LDHRAPAGVGIWVRGNDLDGGLLEGLEGHLHLCRGVGHLGGDRVLREEHERG